MFRVFTRHGVSNVFCMVTFGTFKPYIVTYRFMGFTCNNGTSNIHGDVEPLFITIQAPMFFVFHA